jgi:hypothetical protein
MDATVNARVTPIISGKGPQADLAPGNALVAGMRLREFEIVETLGEGGFSIVYGARDLQLMRDVAIKEYIPISLAGRVASTTVRIRSEHNRETFEAGLNGFINEARLLAQFKHPGLVEVLQFWEENGTAYMVMPRYTGKTLRSVLKEMGGKGDEPWLRGIVAPVLDVLDLLHSRNVFHRDIAPDNILIKNDGTPVLLDLGSAREVVTGLQKAITVVVKPGYAPIEQYSSDFALPQGPWTDVYAVGALLHFAIVGSPPPASISRIMKDSLQPLAGAGLSGYSREFLTAIDRALALQPGDRPQSIAELRALLRVTENDKTIINLAPPPLIAASILAAAPATAVVPDIVEPVAIDIDRPGSEDERTVIVSAQEVAALVQQLAGAKAAAAAAAQAAPPAPVVDVVPIAPLVAAAHAAEAESDSAPVAAAIVESVVEPPPFVMPIAAFVEPIPAAPIAAEPVAAPPVAVEPLSAPVVAAAVAETIAAPAAVDLAIADSTPPVVVPEPVAVIEAVAVNEPIAPVVVEPIALALADEPVAADTATPGPSADKHVFTPASTFELTLEPMDKPESLADREPVVVSESRLEPVTLPPTKPAASGDSDATAVMPAPRPLIEATKPAAKPASTPLKPAASSDATVVMAAPEAIALARSVAASAPTPVAANADAPTIVMPSPVALAKPAPSALELDPLAMPSKHEKPVSNSFPEMEDLLSGRLAAESRPVVVPAVQPARSESSDKPAAAAIVAASAPSRPWLLPAIGGGVLVIAATLLTWYLTSSNETVEPPPIVATTTPAATTPAVEPPAATATPDATATSPALTTTETPATLPVDPNATVTAAIDPNAAPGAADPNAGTAATVDATAAATVPSADAGQVLAPIAAPAETTSASFESPGQTIPPAVTAPPAETPPVAAATPAANATAAADKPATPSADAVKTVDLTASTATPRSEDTSSRSRDSATRAKRDANKVALAKTGNVKLSIQPWGEVWINGSLKGVSPPMRFLQLEPGTYNVELRNPGLQSMRRQLVVTAGQPATIEHRFQHAAGGGAAGQ